MNSLLLALITITGYFIAYHTYGKFLSKKIFRLDPNSPCPSVTLRDDQDFVPTKKEILFGHHFTSIAGLGPIIGPAIAVIWGWLPAILWIFFGSIFMGAIHDFGALILSIRGQGKSMGDIASNIVNKRTRTLFLLIIFFAVWIVIAVFALIISILFNMYPQSIIPIWTEIPIAVWLGCLVYKRGAGAGKPGLIAVIIMYITVIIGAFFPITMPAFLGLPPNILWMIILFIYIYIASTLPVQTLLQPRDYINSHQLLIAMALMLFGIIIAHPPITAPVFNTAAVSAPSIWPFIFIVVACGAVSGFHSLIGSGTTSKQCRKETDSLFIGYGSMLLEAVLATLVIIAVSAGLGMGLLKNGVLLKGAEAFNAQYSSWDAASGLGAKLNAFVTGAANLINSIGIPVKIAVTIMGVFIVSFASTTLDSAARVQRYVISELARGYNIKFLQKRHPATIFAVGTAILLAFSNPNGNGALILWPLFGAVNQLLAGLTLLVITIYLAKKKIPVVFTVIPMIFMLVITGWAMTLNLKDYFHQQNWLLFFIGGVIFFLEIWMVIESAVILKKTIRGKFYR